MGQRHGGDPPGLFGGQDAVDAGVGQAVCQDAGAGHEERRREAVGFLFGVGAVGNAVLAVQDEVAQFMGGVEPAPLARLSGIEQYVWCLAPDE